MTSILTKALIFYAMLSMPLHAQAYKAGDRIGHYIIGETLHYSINWGPLEVGRGSFSTSIHKHESLGDLIQLRFSSKSSGLANKLYPVDDCIDTYLSPTTLRPLYVVKKTKEGDFVSDSTLSFDYDLMEVALKDRHNNSSTNYPITELTTDFYSLLHTLRNQKLSEGIAQRRHVAVDARTHEIEIELGKSKKISVKGLGKVACQKVEISALTEGLFVKKFPSDIWITKNEPHVLASMKIKVPVGSVKIKFHKREILPADEHFATITDAKDQG